MEIIIKKPKAYEIEGRPYEEIFPKERKDKKNSDLSKMLNPFCRYAIRLKTNYEAFEVFKRQHLIYTDKLDLHMLFERSFKWNGNKHLVLNELYSRNINAAQNAFKIIMKNTNTKTNIFYKAKPNGNNIFLNEIKAYNNYRPYLKKFSYFEYLYNEAMTKVEFIIEELACKSEDLGTMTILTKDWNGELQQEATMTISDVVDKFKNYISEISASTKSQRKFMISKVDILPFIKNGGKFVYEQNNTNIIISIYDKDEKLLKKIELGISDLIKDFEKEINESYKFAMVPSPFARLKFDMPILTNYDENSFDNDRYGNELMTFIDYHCKCNLNIDISSENKIYELKKNMSQLRQLMPWISIDEDNIDKILVYLYEIYQYLSSSDSKKIMQEIVNDAKRLTVDSTENEVSAFKIKVDKLKESIDELSIGQISELKEQITKLNEAVSLLYVEDNLMKMYGDNCKYIKERSIYTKDLSLIMDLLLDTINKDKELQKSQQRQHIERIAYKKNAESGTYTLLIELYKTSNILSLNEIKDRLRDKLTLKSTKNGVKISLCVTSEDFERLCGIIRNNVDEEYIKGNASERFHKKYTLCRPYTMDDIKDMLMQISLEDFEKFFIEFDKNAQVELKLKDEKTNVNIESTNEKGKTPEDKLKRQFFPSVEEILGIEYSESVRNGVTPNHIRLNLLLMSALTPIGDNYNYRLKKTNISDQLMLKIQEVIKRVFT